MPDDDGRLTILQVVSHAAGRKGSRSVGGPERRALSALPFWDYSRFRLVITYSPEGRLRDEFRAAADANPHITLLPIAAPRRRDWRALGFFLRAIRRHAVDVVHSQGPHGTDWWAALAARLAGAASVVTRPVALSQYGLPPRTFHRFRILDRLSLLATFAMVFVSEDVRAASIACGETTPADSRVIRNGVDLRRFEPSGSRSKSAPTLGMVGQLLPVKDWDTFLSACARVFDEMPEARALVVGDGPERARIAEAIEAGGLSDRVTMTGFRTDIANVLDELDVFMLTSRREGLPVAIIEAMAMAKPVVATDVGGVREIVADGRTGFLVEPGEAQAIADSVVRLLRDADLRGRFGAAARRDAEARLSMEAMVRSYEQLYTEAATARGRVGIAELSGVGAH